MKSICNFNANLMFLALCVVAVILAFEPKSIAMSTGEALANACEGIMTAANYTLVKSEVIGRVEKDDKDNYQALKGRRDEGVLYDVEIWEGDQTHWSGGPYYIGIGKTPIDAWRPVKNQWTIGPKPPDGYTQSTEKSFLIWVTIDESKANTLKLKILTSITRDSIKQQLKSN